MVPLSEALFNRRAQAEELGQDGKMKRPVEAKVFEAMTEQVWALFPGYCDLPVDLTSALSPHFIELLANVLYTQPTLRPSVCRGLQVLVERNEALASSGAPADVLRASFGLDQDAGRKNIAHLADLAPNLLAVFSNIFSQSPGESRGYVAEVLAAYLRVMKPADVASTYAKIVGMLRSSLPTLVPAHDRETGPKVVPPVPHTMLDLLIVLLPFLDASKPDSEASQLFDLATEDELMRAKDAGLQKKTYRILARLIDGPRGVAVLRLPSTAEGGEGAGRVGELLAKLRDSTANVVAGAKRDRVALLAALVPRIPATELHFLPSIIPEAVLATKETNQGTRELAYDLLVAMGHKMDAGGSIKRGLVEGAAGEEADEDMEGGQAAAPAPAAVSEEVAAASVNEYMTMVAAGLAGSTPHMISASITALSRLVYEFRADVPVETLHELLSTIEVFIRSANREIVKSALGFVKVVIVSLQASIVDEHLPVLIPALFGFSPQHRQHFKSKIRHIFERLLRRFGFERVVSLTGEEDKKLLNNIRKRKERAKRRKNSAEDGERAADDDDDAGPGIGARALKSHGVDAFEEAIYGSESDLSDSDDDNAGDGAEALAQRASDARGAKGGKKGQQPVKPKKTRRQEEETYIREDDDVPMDLLDRSAAAGGISTARATSGNGKAARARRPGQEAATFELDEATGRMLINDPDSASGQAADPASVDVDGAGRAYTDRERGTHGVTMRDGVVRVNKNNKRNRAEDELLDEEQMAVEAAAEGAQDAAKAKRKKKAPQAIGAAYAAKRAQGDVSRKGAPSPFAYVPLGQVAGKKGARADKMDITGKGKKGPRGRL
jgi:ribosomal RNA-processing protein 12